MFKLCKVEFVATGARAGCIADGIPCEGGTAKVTCFRTSNEGFLGTAWAQLEKLVTGVE